MKISTLLDNLNNKKENIRINYDKKIKVKNKIAYYLLGGGTILFFISAIGLALKFGPELSMLIGVTISVTSFMFSCALSDKITELIKNKQLDLENTKYEIFSKLKEDKELVQELSHLGVDDDSNELFKELINNLVAKDNKEKTLDLFYKLINYQQNKAQHQQSKIQQLNQKEIEDLKVKQFEKLMQIDKESKAKLSYML